MIHTSGVRVSPLRVAGNGASDPVTALGASPSRRPLAIPAPHLLSTPWECVTNIRRVPHLELATARAPFLRASVQVSLRLASPCPLPPAGNASLRNPRTLTRWLVGCWLRVCRPLFGGWFSLVHLGQGCQGPKCREALNPSRAGVEEAASRAGEAPGDGSSPSSAREGSSDPTLGPSEQCGSHAPRDTGLQLLGRADRRLTGPVRPESQRSGGVGAKPPGLPQLIPKAREPQNPHPRGSVPAPHAAPTPPPVTSQ